MKATRRARKVSIAHLRLVFFLVAGFVDSRLEAVSPLLFGGICDASAAESLDGELVAVGDDEDNSIRVYSRRLGGMPLVIADLSSFLKVGTMSLEADLEGSARVGDRIYWISSHGRNARGKARPSRGQLFATTACITNGTITLEPIGRPYRRLLSDLSHEPRLARFDLRSASQSPPKSRGALNIEGLAATPDGQLLVGFRNPIPNGKALLIPIENPADLPVLKAARFGDPILLDLQGLGVRSITWAGERFLILAGPYDDGGKSLFFEWKGGGEPARRIGHVNLMGLNPEAIAMVPESQSPAELFITSDDGTVKIGGKSCKTLKDPYQKCFRALTITSPVPL